MLISNFCLFMFTSLSPEGGPSQREIGMKPEEPAAEAGSEVVESKRTKAEAQQELQDKFGMRDTPAFLSALEKGDTEQAKAWLQHIVDNRDDFPQYQDTWDSWVRDRQDEIAFYEANPASKESQESTVRTKEEAQKELEEKFGMRKTSDFQDALKSGKIKEAKAWLQYVVDNKDAIPQYRHTWDRWLLDRQSEIEQAEAQA